MNNKIFFFENNLLKLKNKLILKKCILNTIKKYSYNLKHINYIFCTKLEIKSLNKKYLHKNNYTDIIAFNYENKKNIFADIYICYNVVKENSKIYMTDLQEELHRVMIHGVLHLCGFKDDTDTGKKEMQKIENFKLKELKKLKSNV